MTLAIKTFEDLVLIIETHPEWRQRLKRALFDIDMEAALAKLEKAVAELVETQRQHAVLLQEISIQIRQLLEVQRQQAEDIQTLKGDVSVLKDDVSVLKGDVSVLKDDVSVLKRDVSSLKGKVYEHDYRLKASGIFGRFIRRGKDRTDDVADQLYEALAVGQVSEAEIEQVLAADLLWGGKAREIETDITIVLESSWRAETNDVERAYRRAAILQRIGFRAVPVVAGMEWDGQALIQAQTLGVAFASNGLVNADSWRVALTPKVEQG